MLNVFSKLFPLWLLISTGIALYFPSAFQWLKGDGISMLLGFIMLGMGLTLKTEDLQPVIQQPYKILIGFILQYTIMPSIAYVIGILFQLPPPLAAGLIIVGCCPGGTASNVMTYLAKGDVALSVAMTAVSTIFAAVMTPFLTWMLLDNKITVDAFGLLWSTVKVILLPVVAGILIRSKWKSGGNWVQEISPAVAILFICMIVGSVVANNKKMIIDGGIGLILAVSLFHFLGFLLGYSASWLMVKDKTFSRTVAIETSMQNSGLGVVLSQQNFAHPATAVPSAIASLMQSLIGSIFAWIWRR